MKEILKKLLQELIDKEVNLDQTAKILWELRLYTEIRWVIDFWEYEFGDSDDLADKRNLLERTRGQLDHYLTVNNIQSVSVRMLDNMPDGILR